MIQSSSTLEQTLGNTDQRAAKAESNSARLSAQLDDLLKEFQLTKQAYTTIQQKYDKVSELNTLAPILALNDPCW